MAASESGGETDRRLGAKGEHARRGFSVPFLVIPALSFVKYRPNQSADMELPGCANFSSDQAAHVLLFFTFLEWKNSATPYIPCTVNIACLLSSGTLKPLYNQSFLAT